VQDFLASIIPYVLPPIRRSFNYPSLCITLSNYDFKMLTLPCLNDVPFFFDLDQLPKSISPPRLLPVTVLFSQPRKIVYQAPPSLLMMAFFFLFFWFDLAHLLCKTCTVEGSLAFSVCVIILSLIEFHHFMYHDS